MIPDFCHEFEVPPEDIPDLDYEASEEDIRELRDGFCPECNSENFFAGACPDCHSRIVPTREVADLCGMIATTTLEFSYEDTELWLL